MKGALYVLSNKGIGRSFCPRPLKLTEALTFSLLCTHWYVFSPLSDFLFAAAISL